MTALAATNGSPPESFPALVLNADFHPLSYYPLSLWNWQETIKAVFLDRVNIVSHYDQRGAQPQFRDEASERRLAQDLRKAGAVTRPSPASTCFCATVSMPILRVRRTI